MHTLGSVKADKAGDRPACPDARPGDLGEHRRRNCEGGRSPGDGGLMHRVRAIADEHGRPLIL